MGKPTVFGAGYSVYVRAVRLALEEKGVAYRLEEVDIFAEGGPPADYLARQPFGRIPAFEHDGFRLYETGAITRYVDEAFEGPALSPATAQGRARMNQITGILDSYAYRTWVWDIYVAEQEAGDPAKIAAALPRAETCLAAIADLMTPGPYFLGPAPCLADLQAAPMVALFGQSAAGADLMARHDRWAAWWPQISARPSMIATRAQKRVC